MGKFLSSDGDVLIVLNLRENLGTISLCEQVPANSLLKSNSPFKSFSNSQWWTLNFIGRVGRKLKTRTLDHTATNGTVRTRQKIDRKCGIKSYHCTMKGYCQLQDILVENSND